MAQVCVTCRSNECDLYWVSTAIRAKPAFTRLLRTKSMSR